VLYIGAAFVALGGMVIYFLVRYARRAALLKEQVKRLHARNETREKADAIDEAVDDMSADAVFGELRDDSK